MTETGAGWVYWITGLSGAGKSTLAKGLFEHLRKQRDGVVFLDGDELREVFGHSAHSLDDRRLSMMRNARLCRMLSLQGLDVVCATISMYHEVRRWNREHLLRYREIYLRVPMDVLRIRDPKGLYRRADGGMAKDVYGIDLEFEEPECPDLLIENHGVVDSQAALGEVLRAFSL